MHPYAVVPLLKGGRPLDGLGGNRHRVTALGQRSSQSLDNALQTSDDGWVELADQQDPSRGHDRRPRNQPTSTTMAPKLCASSQARPAPAIP